MENKIEEEFDKLSKLIRNIKAGSGLSLGRIFEFEDTIDNLRKLYNDSIIEIKQNQNKKKELEINSFVVFDEDSCTKEDYEKYYKDDFPLGKSFLYLGEIKKTDGQCIICDSFNSKIHTLCFSENFREATEDEC